MPYKYLLQMHKTLPKPLHIIKSLTIQTPCDHPPYILRHLPYIKPLSIKFPNTFLTKIICAGKNVYNLITLRTKNLHPLTYFNCLLHTSVPYLVVQGQGDYSNV